jgi:hypothetical protein
MATDLDKKISDIITGVIVALKAKGIDNLSVHKIVNYINDKYNVILDDDVVKDVLSTTAGVAEINDDKVLIGKAPDNENDAEEAVAQGSKTFDDGTGGAMGGGAPMGGDAGGDMSLDGSEDMSNMDDNSTDTSTDSSADVADASDDMEAPLSELNV